MRVFRSGSGHPSKDTIVIRADWPLLVSKFLVILLSIAMSMLIRLVAGAFFSGRVDGRDTQRVGC